MRIRTLLLVLLLGSLFTACSVLPKRIHPLQKSSADQILALAQGKELNQQYHDAILMYDHAFRQYQEFADLEGLLQCLAGHARIHLSLDDQDKYETILEEMEQLILNTTETKRYHLLLVELHRLSGAHEWGLIAKNAVSDESYPHMVNLQILSYRVQANTFLKIKDANSVKELNRLYKSSLRKMRNHNMPQVVSQAAYSLAYHYFNHGEPGKAKKHLKVSSRIDYANALFTALGYDLWLSAKIAAQEGNLEKAKLDLSRAALILERHNQSAQAEAIRRELKELTVGGKP